MTYYERDQARSAGNTFFIQFFVLAVIAVAMIFVATQKFGTPKHYLMAPWVSFLIACLAAIMALICLIFAARSHRAAQR